MTDLAKRTWPEAKDLFGPDTVVLLPVGSTEPHGPHLPLDTDVTIAVAQAERAAARLEADGVRALVLPALPYGLTEFTSGFPGAVSLRPGTLWALLEDIVNSLEDQGVRRVVFCNAHLEPEHVAVLRGVILDHAELTADRAQAVFPDNTRRRWAQTLSDEFRSGECHAGSYETGIVMAADPDAVREDERAGLAPVTIGLIEKMQAGAKSFAECGSEHAYCGDPAAASADEGREQIERLAEMVVTTCRETWPELWA
jgi:creatinine amidohydrolase